MSFKNNISKLRYDLSEFEVDIQKGVFVKEKTVTT